MVVQWVDVAEVEVDVEEEVFSRMVERTTVAMVTGAEVVVDMALLTEEEEEEVPYVYIIVGIV